MREFVIGDIHGGYLALKQVLDKVNFDYENDTLISLGDVTDGWPDVAECIELLMSIKNLKRVKGNHDDWSARFLKLDLKSKITEEVSAWYYQGGSATYESYLKHPELKEKHIKYMEESPPYYIDDKNRLFLHAGFDTNFPIDEQEETTYFWDRRFIANVSRGFMDGTENFTEIYIGHTPTISEYKHGRPVNFGNVWNMDTGGTYMGKLSLMNINTKELTQSDPVFLLYPEHKGRNGVLLAEDPNWNKWGLFLD